jgi:hypothetical protein
VLRAGEPRGRPRVVPEIDDSPIVADIPRAAPIDRAFHSPSRMEARGLTTPDDGGVAPPWRVKTPKRGRNGSSIVRRDGHCFLQGEQERAAVQLAAGGRPFH